MQDKNAEAQLMAEQELKTTRCGLSRRRFLQTAGAGATLLGVGSLAACQAQPAAAPAGESGVASTSGSFYASCSPECQHHNLMVEIEDGVAERVLPGLNNESSPCIRGLARTEWLNSEERLTTPLLRDGEKGSNQWKEISWDEALDLLAEKLNDAIETGGNASIVNESHAGNFHSLAGAVGPAFMARIGGCTTLTGTLCCAGMNGATVPMFGKRYFDTRNTIEDSDYILIWGNNPVVTMGGYWNRFQNVMANGGKVVVLDPVRSESAAESDDWIKIKPTTDTALALGMLKAIVDEDLHNTEFLLSRTTCPCLIGKDGESYLLDPEDATSFAVVDAKTNTIVRHDDEDVEPLLSIEGTEFAADYTTAFDLIMAECEPWTLEAVEAETGVPAEKVHELAHEYAEAKNAMILQNMGGYMRVTYGTYAVAAQNYLALFTGHIGRAGTGLYDAGGVTNIVTATPMFENPKVDENLPKIPRVQFAKHVLEDDPNPIKVFISSRVSPMTQYPNTALLKQALIKIPFVVVIDMFMTSTALYADLVLPCAAVFETEDLLCSSRSHLIQLSEKALDPPGEAHNDLWIFREIAKKMGVGEDFEHEPDFYIKKALASTDYTYEMLQEEKSIDAMPVDFIPYEDGFFYTESTKAEVYQDSWLKKDLKAVATYVKHSETVGGDSGLDAKYPLAAVQRKLMRSVHSSFGNLPSMVALQPHPLILVNSEDAAERGIANGDMITAFNDRGEHSGEAVVSADIMKGVVCLENGWWEQQGGSSSYVTNDAAGPIATEHCCNETLVDIKPKA